MYIVNAWISYKIIFFNTIEADFYGSLAEKLVNET